MLKKTTLKKVKRNVLLYTIKFSAQAKLPPLPLPKATMVTGTLFKDLEVRTYLEPWMKMKLCMHFTIIH
jgi:hypothetical protein